MHENRASRTSDGQSIVKAFGEAMVCTRVLLQKRPEKVVRLEESCPPIAWITSVDTL